MRKTGLRILSAILLCALLFAGCANNNPQSTNKPDDSAVVLPTPTPAADIIPNADGKLYMYVPRNAVLANPLTVNTEVMQSMYSLIFESLIELDESAMVVPCLASSWTRSETDQNTWVFSLRENCKWQKDRGQFTGKDVVDTIEAIRELGEDNYYYECIEDIVRYSYSETEPYKLSITFSHPGLSAVAKLTFPIIKTSALDAQIPIGTGAYEVVRSNDTSTVLQANQNWWKRAPYISQITYLVRDSEEIALDSYSAGQLNFITTSALYSGTYRESNHTNVVDFMTQDMEVMLFNHKKALLKDSRMRRALAYCVNRQEIISYVYMNKAHECDVPIAPDAYAYDGAYKLYDYNTEKALSLLTELGYSDNDDDGKLELGVSTSELTLRLLVNTVSQNMIRSDAAKKIQEQFAKVGITVEVIEAEFNREDGGEYLRMLKEGDFDIALCGFNMSMAYDLRAVLSSSGDRNYGRYSSAEMDSLVTALYMSKDEAETRANAGALMKGFTEELPFMVLYYRMNSLIYTSELKGVTALRKPDILRNIENWYMYE